MLLITASAKRMQWKIPTAMFAGALYPLCTTRCQTNAKALAQMGPSKISLINLATPAAPIA
jgi:hypothetical protein